MNFDTPRILSLETHVVDQIAAGEVLERPAHMVKELIENSLDAKSTEIEIHLDDGGRSLTLIDNGVGFHPEDLTLALLRHTTSKLKTTEDLSSISTYGFRGEALASISSVSHMTIQTHRRGERCVKLLSEFGEVKSLVDSSLDFGTRIEISRLYENTPARLKFLKTDASEVMEIKKVLYAFGLCQPELSLKFFYRDQLEFFWPNKDSSVNERIKNILATKELYTFKKDFGDIQVEVHFAPPHETAKSNRKLWTFVQNRWVIEPMVLAAIRDGFQNTLLPGEYPIGAVFIKVPSDFVDVNVHPTKSKVKFKDQSLVYRAVRQTLIEFVELSPWREEFLKPNLEYTEYLHSVDTSKIRTPNYAFGSPQDPKSQTGFELKAFRTQRTANLNGESLNSNPNLEIQNYASALTPGAELSSSVANTFWANLLVIGQVAKTYIVTQNQNEVVYIDQHAAHERCLFEKLWQSFKQGIALETQRHLLPLTFKLEDESFIEVLLKNTDALAKLGILFEQSGPLHLEIIETPSLIKDKAVIKALEKMVEQISTHGQSFIFEDVISDIFATMACHSAIRAGQILTLPEMEELLDLMDDYSTTSYCPHGRPVFVRYSLYQIEKDFCRKV